MKSESGEGRTCAVCGKPESAEYRPFCSKRCADVDLQRWFSGAYAVPAEEDQGPDGSVREVTDV